MRVTANEDGTFVFTFSPEEKNLGLHLLNCIKPYNEESKQHLEAAKNEVMCAGMHRPDKYN